MRQGYVLLLAFVLPLLASAGCNPAAPTPIGDILEHPDRFVNSTVTVQGVTSNSEGVTPDPRASRSFTGQFELEDETGKILVKTTKDAPANNKPRYRVSGIVHGSGTEPLFIEQRGGAIDIRLLAALAVLVVLAIVLVVLLVRKPHPVVEQTPIEPRLGQVPVGSICPACQTQNDPDAKFCENCRNPLSLAQRPFPDPRTPKDLTQFFDPEEQYADLTVIEGPDPQGDARFPLGKARKMIGRQEGMDIRLNDQTVSRKHASIRMQDGTFFIEDEDSTSGTLVNGQKVARQSLADKDVIQLGKTKLVFRILTGPRPS